MDKLKIAIVDIAIGDRAEFGIAIAQTLHGHDSVFIHFNSVSIHELYTQK